jgi:branched-chain amino acid transport system ATP-binding protein
MEFGGLKALSTCSISVKPGTITGLIGPNGAGKTTLFNVITGFLRPTGGEVRFSNERIDSLPPHRIFRKGIVRTFQIPRPFTSMSVVENLMLFHKGQLEAVWDGWLVPRRVGRKEAEIYKKALDVLELVGLSHLTDASAGHLSGGQKKLLEMGRALMSDPQLILLDEPGAGINPTLAKQLMTAVQRLRRDFGITFLIIEHDMDLVAQNCNPVIVMSEGQWLMQGTPEEVRKDPRVLDAYLGT